MSPQRTHRPWIQKKGTIDSDMVETTPVVFLGRLYRFEYVRESYQQNSTGESYFRFIEIASGEHTPPFAEGFHLGVAHAQADTMYVYGVPRWGGSSVHVFRSRDLEHWKSTAALTTEGWGLYNTSVCEGLKNPYVMAVEVGGPPEVVGVRFTVRFAVSQNLISWKLLPPNHVYSREKYTACPSIRRLNGYFYMFYLEKYPGPNWATHLVRSRDLARWEESPLNPVLAHSETDKIIRNDEIPAGERRRIESIINVNNSDIDLCEYRGKTIIYYSWGTQHGDEFLAEAEYDGSLKDLVEGFFPETVYQP